VRARRVGIDIEAERPLTDVTLLARRILTPREGAAFEALPEAARPRALLAAWTRKEAVLKAIGTGVSGGLASIEVLLGADTRDDVAIQSAEVEWRVRTLAMPPSFHGAMAIEGEAPRVVMWQAAPQRDTSA
jgi:4'-phosphopantetheinyl transferase